MRRNGVQTASVAAAEDRVSPLLRGRAWRDRDRDPLAMGRSSWPRSAAVAPEAASPSPPGYLRSKGRHELVRGSRGCVHRRGQGRQMRSVRVGQRPLLQRRATVGWRLRRRDLSAARLLPAARRLVSNRLRGQRCLRLQLLQSRLRFPTLRHRVPLLFRYRSAVDENPPAAVPGTAGWPVGVPALPGPGAYSGRVESVLPTCIRVLILVPRHPTRAEAISMPRALEPGEQAEARRKWPSKSGTRLRAGPLLGVRAALSCAFAYMPRLEKGDFAAPAEGGSLCSDWALFVPAPRFSSRGSTTSSVEMSEVGARRRAPCKCLCIGIASDAWRRPFHNSDQRSGVPPPPPVPNGRIVLHGSQLRSTCPRIRVEATRR
jgi:hypothetical protein